MILIHKQIQSNRPKIASQLMLTLKLVRQVLTKPKSSKNPSHRNNIPIIEITVKTFKRLKISMLQRAVKLMIQLESNFKKLKYHQSLNQSRVKSLRKKSQRNPKKVQLSNKNSKMRLKKFHKKAGMIKNSKKEIISQSL